MISFFTPLLNTFFHSSILWLYHTVLLYYSFTLLFFYSANLCSFSTKLLLTIKISYQVKQRKTFGIVYRSYLQSSCSISILPKDLTLYWTWCETSPFSKMPDFWFSEFMSRLVGTKDSSQQRNKFAPTAFAAFLPFLYSAFHFPFEQGVHLLLWWWREWGWKAGEIVRPLDAIIAELHLSLLKSARWPELLLGKCLSVLVARLLVEIINRSGIWTKRQVLSLTWTWLTGTTCIFETSMSRVNPLSVTRLVHLHIIVLALNLKPIWECCDASALIPGKSASWISQLCHVQTLCGPLAVSLLLWFGSSLHDDCRLRGAKRLVMQNNAL